MSDVNVRSSVSSAPNVYDSGLRETGWGTAEMPRLQNMDHLLAEVTRKPLSSVLESLPEGANLLDIGAGAGTTVEELCAENGADYYALDVNAQLLAGRDTPHSHKVLGRAESLPFKHGAFDVTLTRAVTGWNADPKRAIEEQLRITKLGGVAVFMEFDWDSAGMDWDSKGFAAGMLAKLIMMKALSAFGFKPTYGQGLEKDIDAVIARTQLDCTREGNTVVLPAGDHRGVLLDAADQISGQLMRTPKAVMLGQELASAANEMRSFPEGSLTVNLPAIAIHTVRKSI